MSKSLRPDVDIHRFCPDCHVQVAHTVCTYCKRDLVNPDVQSSSLDDAGTLPRTGNGVGASYLQQGFDDVIGDVPHLPLELVT